MVYQFELFNPQTVEECDSNRSIPKRIRECIDFLIDDAKQGCKMWNRGFSNDYGAYISMPDSYKEEVIEDYLQNELFSWQEIEKAEGWIIKLGNKLDTSQLL